MTDQHPLAVDSKLKYSFQLPESSNWKCYMFGNRPGGMGFVYYPTKGKVPNRFVRFMMKICFDCLWVKDDNND